MKRITILMTLVTMTISGFSQYSKLIDENKQWVESYYYQDLTDIRDGETTFFFTYFKGDTVIKDTTYHKLMKQRFYLETWYTNDASHFIDSTLKKAELYSYLREDTINRKVYMLYPFQTNGVEELIYDFLLDVGDSLSTDAGTFFLDSIVDVELNNSTMRKRFCFTNPNEDLTGYYIEGIGGYNGILEPFYGIGLSGAQSSGNIICYSEDSIELYGSCDYPEYIIANIRNQSDLQDIIRLYPNPANDRALIDLGSVNVAAKIKIHDIRGTILLEEKYLNTKYCDIELNSLNSGIYLITIVLDNQESVLLRMIKN